MNYGDMRAICRPLENGELRPLALLIDRLHEAVDKQDALKAQAYVMQAETIIYNPPPGVEEEGPVLAAVMALEELRDAADKLTADYYAVYADSIHETERYLDVWLNQHK